MHLKGEEYSKRLEGYSIQTLQLISKILETNRITIYQMDEITTNAAYDEAEVARRLEKLLKDALERKAE